MHAPRPRSSASRLLGLLASAAAAFVLTSCGINDLAAPTIVQPSGLYGSDPAKGYGQAHVAFADTGVDAAFECLSFSSLGPWQVDADGTLFSFSVIHPEGQSSIGPYTVVKGGQRTTVTCWAYLL